MITVKYSGDTYSFSLTKNKVYCVLSIEKSWYRIIDDSFEDYLYPKDLFIDYMETNECISIEFTEDELKYINATFRDYPEKYSFVSLLYELATLCYATLDLETNSHYFAMYLDICEKFYKKYQEA